MQEMQRCGLDSWVGKIPWIRKWQLTSVFLAGKFHGQRSLVGYSPWGSKESDRTERLTQPFLITQRKVTCDLMVSCAPWGWTRVGGRERCWGGLAGMTWCLAGYWGWDREKSSQRCWLWLVQLTAMDVQLIRVLISYENHYFVLYFISHFHGRFIFFLLHRDIIKYPNLLFKRKERYKWIMV